MYIMSLEMAQLLTGKTKPLFEYLGPVYKQAPQQSITKLHETFSG